MVETGGLSIVGPGRALIAEHLPDLPYANRKLDLEMVPYNDCPGGIDARSSKDGVVGEGEVHHNEIHHHILEGLGAKLDWELYPPFRINHFCLEKSGEGCPDRVDLAGIDPHLSYELISTNQCFQSVQNVSNNYQLWE